ARWSWGEGRVFRQRSWGCSLAYTYEVVAYDPTRRLVMRTADGPFPMETSYLFEDTSSGGTKMTLRNHGKPARFSRLVAPLMAPAMRRTNCQDLRRLKAIIEARTS